MKHHLLRTLKGVGVVIITLFLCYACSVNKKLKVIETTNSIKADSISFHYSKISGVGFDSGCNRRDNSDIIKVDDKYYVYYSKMDSLTTSGYWASIWYATSEDEGYTWQEQGIALGLGEKGTFDSHSVFTPNILEYEGKYYLYYTGVKPTPGNKDNIFESNSTNDYTAIGLAVADSPNGPFLRSKNNPVLEISQVAEDFDSYRIDDAALLVRDNKVWLYYKGRSILYGKEGPKHTKMGLAIADKPEGPFIKQTKPLIDKGHEVMIWNQNGGIASLASLSQSIHFADDGIHFSPIYIGLVNIPKALGLYRPSLNDGNRNAQVPGWGIAMTHKNKRVYLMRYIMSKK
ncbi:family 43 glycosylhydrolase [Labilibaculum antarcticum]|uniref:Uncharacterized protein n=1 Tax=Labilibaculum antarcticum TaxID=1717717 RepID=A0A1Y1CER3_9BACT|nr:family 43 glycosylhydrolase [Labilibaculum antarcticum]BAX78815.1 hypothetical protein ALGA_0421 [Labilibaculum antarcticum]